MLDKIISQEIEKIIDRCRSAQPESLYAPIAYAMEGGGKRIRPRLALMACEAFCLSFQPAVSPAIGLEMFHNFTLLHDDVMDNSPTRRNRLSVFGKWGVNPAILSGDTMLTMATRLVTDVDHSRLPMVLDCFNAMAIDVYEGQAYDMDFEERSDVTIDQYLKMISLKTGALLAAACRIGAICAGASDRDCRLMYDFGMNLGLAFQIQDDYLDVYGDPTTFGKPIGGDINNNKKTFLMLSALATEGNNLDSLMALPPSDEKVEAVRDEYTRLAIPALCSENVRHFTTLAAEAILSSSMPTDSKEAFISLADKLINRAK